jgi:hypothetical protein
MDGWSERGRPAVREALDQVREVIDREVQHGTLVLSPLDEDVLLTRERTREKGHGAQQNQGAFESPDVCSWSSTG